MMTVLMVLAVFAVILLLAFFRAPGRRTRDHWASRALR